LDSGALEERRWFYLRREAPQDKAPFPKGVAAKPSGVWGLKPHFRRFAPLDGEAQAHIAGKMPEIPESVALRVGKIR